MKTILVFEQSKRGPLEKLFHAEGFLVVSVSTEQELRSRLADRQRLDLIVLHQQLPAAPLDEAFWSHLKECRFTCPTLVLTKNNSPADRIQQLRLGADDALSLPYDEQELVARAYNLIGRPEDRPGTVGNTVVKQQLRIITVNGKSHRLPAKEFYLLKCLTQEPGRVFDRNVLLDEVWGVDSEFDTNVLEATISNLRRRLAKLGSNVKIKNSRNLGYWIEG